MGDWVKLINNDLDMIDMGLNEDLVKEMSKVKYKSEVRKKVKTYVK